MRHAAFTHLQATCRRVVSVSLAGAALALVAQAEVRIVGPAGEAIAGARLTVVLPSGIASPTLFGAPRVFGASDAAGRLPFALPSLADTHALVDAEGYAPRLLVLSGARPPALLHLERGETFRGQLTGDGEIPPGPGSACVTWTALAPEKQKPLTARRCGAVHADGSWEIAALPSAAVELRIDVPGYLPLARTVSAPGSDLALALDPGERALVRVETGLGRGVAAATIACDGAVSTPTGAAGAAWIALPGASAPCRASHPSAGESLRAPVAAPREKPQILKLGAATGFAGRVLGEDGTVPEALRFQLVKRLVEVSGRRTLPVEAIFDDEGAFRLAIEEAGTYALEIEAPGWRTASTEPFDLALGERMDVGLLTLRRGAGVAATLADAASGRPLAGSVVTVRPAGRARLVLAGRVGTTTLADDEGRFLAAGLPVGRYVVEGHAPGLAPWIVELDLPEERVEELGLVGLDPPVQVSGQLLRPDGAPLAGLRVDFLRSPFRDAEPIASSQTDAEGRFAPVAIASGGYRILVSADRLLLDREIAIPRGAARHTLELRVRSTHVSGWVMEGGVPVAGGEVVLRRLLDPEFALGVVVVNRGGASEQRWTGRPAGPTSSAVGADGAFAVDDAPTGRVKLSYFAAEGERALRFVDIADERQVTLAIDVAGETISGSLVDRDTRRGVAADLELLDERSAPVTRATSDAAGAFTLPGIVPGSYRLLARARGYRLNEISPLAVTDLGTPPLLVEMEPADEARLAVRLERPEGSRAAAVALVLVDAGGRSLRALSADANGRLGLSDLEPGRVAVVWADPLAGTGATPLFALREGERELALTLAPGRDLIVRCAGDECAGARLPWLALLTADGLDLTPYLLRSSAIVFSEEGTARLGRLAPGTYTLVAATLGSRLERAVEVTSGPGEIEISLPRR